MKAETVKNNPVTTVAGVGAVITMIGHFLKWDDQTMLVVTQGVIGLALIARGAVAWFDR